MATTTEIKVTGIDNRGTKDCPFGFVYFNDDDSVRVGFSAKHGMFQANWGLCTRRHFALAEIALRDAHLLEQS